MGVDEGNTLYIIDRLTGKTADSTKVQNFRTFSIDQNSGTLGVVQGLAGQITLTLYSTVGASLSPLSIEDYVAGEINPGRSQTFSQGGSLSSFYIGQGLIFTGNTNGHLGKVTASGLETYKQNQIVPIEDISLMEDKLLVLAQSSLRTFKAPFFGLPYGQRLENFNGYTLERQSSNMGRMVPLPSGKILLWSQGEGRSYQIYQGLTGEISETYSPFSHNLNLVRVYKNLLLGLESGGNASTISLESHKALFSFSALGVISFDFIDEQTILASKLAVQAGVPPLLIINVFTGETLPLQDSRFLIFSIISPKGGQKLYTLGFKKQREQIETVLKVHERAKPGEATVLYKIRGEWNEAFLKPFGAEILYGSLNRYNILEIKGRKVKTWNYSKAISTLEYHKGLLYILNKEGSISIFNPQSGTILGTLYLLQNGLWVLLSPSGTYVTSEEGGTYISDPAATGGNPPSFKVLLKKGER